MEMGYHSMTIWTNTENILFPANWDWVMYLQELENRPFPWKQIFY